MVCLLNPELLKATLHDVRKNPGAILLGGAKPVKVGGLITRKER